MILSEGGDTTSGAGGLSVIDISDIINGRITGPAVFLTNSIYGV
jgi:hypothetical protein